MARKEKTNHTSHTRKNRTLLFLLVCSVLLLSTGKVDGKKLLVKKTPSPRTLRAMARVYMAYGEYEKAQPLAEQALISAKNKNASDSELCSCLIDLAYLYNELGRLEDAEKMCVLGLKLQEKVYYEKHPYIAHTLTNLSSIYQAQGRYQKAKAALNRAVTIMLDCHTENDKAMIPFKVAFAQLLTAEGDFKKADTYYQSAMALINKSYGPNHLYTATVLADIAKLYTLQQRYNEAENLINRSVATQEKYYGPKHHLIASSWLTKAEVCRVKKNYAESNRLIEKALSAVKKRGSAVIFAKMKQRADKIRSIKPAAFSAVAKGGK
jgi:tetratricopeptide (TPR) repeat protein